MVPKDNQNNSETKPTDEPMQMKNDEFVVNIHTDILLTDNPRFLKTLFGNINVPNCQVT